MVLRFKPSRLLRKLSIRKQQYPSSHYEPTAFTNIELGLAKEGDHEGRQGAERNNNIAF